MKNEIAILMAAGLGKRMLPLTENTPKPLIKVEGKALIETIIEGLQRRGVKIIYVVVGYLKEQFNYLPEKYKDVCLVENKEYLQKNNISSLYAMGDILGSADCFICEADLYVAKLDVFNKVDDTEFSCYMGKKIEGRSDDWVFEMKNQRITRVKKGGENLYNMVGISYWKKADALCIRDAIRQAYTMQGHEQLFWDEVLDQQLEKLDVTVVPLEANDVIEIDTGKELYQLESILRK